MPQTEMNLKPLTEAQKKRVEESFRYAAWYANRVKEPGEPIDELVSAACEGLIYAVQKYNPKLSKWSTYAYRWMWSRVARYREKKNRFRHPNTLSKCVSEISVPVFDGPIKEESGSIDSLMGPLPKKMREMVYMRVVLGMSFPEISDKLGCARTTVISNVEKAIEILRERFENERI